MSANRINLVLVVLLTAVLAILAWGVSSISAAPLAADPIPGYLSQVNATNLSAVATDLVTLYGPRRWDTYSPYIDAKCTFGTTVYPKSTIEMSSDYVNGMFQGMGYTPSAITMETVPNSAGHNVYVTKVGSTYPNVYIEFGAHLDTVHTPGGSDNASGSTAVIELARVLKDYPNRYSMRFVLFVAEEMDAQWGTGYYGSTYHVQQALARGEQIKAGLIMDHIGWQNSADPTDLMNEYPYNPGDAESVNIANLFNQVRTDYGISIGYRTNQGISNSDNISYWNAGQTAVQSEGGWSTYRPNYHDCGDTVSNIDFANVLRTAQENLAAGLMLDTEVIGATATPSLTPTPTRIGVITIGEANILSNDDSGNGNLLVAQQVTLSQVAAIQSMSFYVTAAVGRLRLGIYDDAGGTPGTLRAQTAEFTPTVGWNIQNVVTPTQLAAGTYWLAYLPQSSSLHFALAFNGSARLYSYTYGALPTTFSSSAQSGTYHWSFYAALSVGTVATTTPTNTPLLPTATNTPTVAANTPTNTATTVSYTPTNTQTNTPTATNTSARTPTRTATGTRTSTRTPTNTRTRTPTNTPTLTPTPTALGAITIGETNILANDDSGNGNLLVAQQVTLGQTATIQSVSFYVTSVSGRVRLGIYDEVVGNPGTLKAQTAEFTPVVGWNTQSVVTPTQLPAGTYWLAYLPESSNLHFRMTTSGTARWYSYTYGALPTTFSSSPQGGTYHWSSYATLR